MQYLQSKCFWWSVVMLQNEISIIPAVSTRRCIQSVKSTNTAQVCWVYKVGLYSPSANCCYLIRVMSTRGHAQSESALNLAI